MIQLVEYETPVGPLSVAADDSMVVASGFIALDEFRQRVAAQGHAAYSPGAEPFVAVGSPLAAAKDAVVAYFDGDLEALKTVPVTQAGTVLQEGVWQALRMISAGQTWSYGQLAAAIGRPAAVRAVGQACGANQVAPFVPCHRAVRSDGSLGGYAFGVDVKRWLLRHEGAE